MEDWRLTGHEDYLTGMTFYKVRFPQFWKRLTQIKMRFSKRQKDTRTTLSNIFTGKKNILRASRYGFSGTNTANSVGMRSWLTTRENFTAVKTLIFGCVPNVSTILKKNSGLSKGRKKN